MSECSVSAYSWRSTIWLFLVIAFCISFAWRSRSCCCVACVENMEDDDSDGSVSGLVSGCCTALLPRSSILGSLCTPLLSRLSISSAIFVVSDCGAAGYLSPKSSRSIRVGLLNRV